ncbi:hypothetical protein AOCH_002808 [Aspergillus ochraceoroseus]|uniref:Extracellular membrane protein CFEM domain-containing protein n=1 Tax=Aspergillus ochraceoroseus TaxID=138278 RepID=A0A0F8UY90_9EURO|nr:hypothetical protein AOCH_002808 [Aspergillus ochraceoroseus]
MLLYLLRWTLIAASFILSCLAEDVRRTTAVSLLDLMPKCAATCIENFIISEYPKSSCSKGCDLTYLCTTNTTSGYTLGEGALRCSLSTCSMEVALSFDTYGICDSVASALPRTHATIVATTMSLVNPTATTAASAAITTTKALTTDSVPITDPKPTSTRTKHTTTTSVTAFQTPVSATDSNQVPSNTDSEEPTVSGTSSISSPSATLSESPGSSPSNGTSLDPGAVIGVSVASGVSGFFIIGVVIFFCCRKIRRKNQHERDRNFFEIGGIMSEPPDFDFPPKRPPLGLQPSPRILNPDSESARPAPLSETENHNYQNPAVVVTEPDNEYGYSRMTTDSTDRMGLKSSSHADFDVASSESSRTVSDLLPDKPTYELCPRPLRWSQQKKLGPSSGETLLEDGFMGPRYFPSSSPQQSSFSGLAGQSYGNSGFSRHLVAGLPAHPRAMLYGFGRGRVGDTRAMNGQDYGKKPIFTNAKEKVQPSPQANVYETPLHQPPQAHPFNQSNDFDSYWRPPDAGLGGFGAGPSRVTARRSFPGPKVKRKSFGGSLGPDFETVDINDNTESRRASHHSGNFRALTPVREIKTPTSEPRTYLSKNISGDLEHAISPPEPPSGLFNPTKEIISRPRIVRRDDIKRVQIRRGKPSAKGFGVPFCPDNYWEGKDTFRPEFPGSSSTHPKKKQ